MIRVLLCFLALGCGSPALSAASRPNIVLIMADDLGVEGLSCYGGTSYRTPHLDRLASEGIRFDRAYSQPLCTPSRIQIMTGKYNQRNWLYFGILPPTERTFGHLLQDAGYRTCIAGKWQLQSYDPPDYPGADKRRDTGMHPKDAGFHEYSLFHSLHTEDKGSRYANPTYLRGHQGEPGELQTVDAAYGEDLSVDFILDFLKRNAKQPCFVYYPMALPHWPFNPTPDSPDWATPSKRLDEHTRYFPDMVHYMDKLMGRLAEGIDELGLGSNTLLLFYSDNGTDKKITSQMGPVSIPGGKGEPTQTGIRVPLIARWTSGIQPGQTNGDLIDASDFLPTLADLAQAEIPSNWHHDGVSFAPQLLGQSGTPRDWCFFWYDPRPGWDKDQFRRHIFALDHSYKLFADGRFFKLHGPGLLLETQLSSTGRSPEAMANRARLSRVLEEMMKPPLSAAAQAPSE